MSEPSDERFERIYCEHGDRLWRAVLAYSGDPEIAKDAVSEAFAQAMRGADAIRSPVPWLYKAAFRIAAGELKERARRSAALPEGSYEMPATSSEIFEAIAQLSPKQRACVILCLYAGFSTREAASMIASTAPAVRVHLSLGRKRLRETLGDDDA